MTARERALCAVVEDGDTSGAQYVNAILDEIESAGLAIVDRELHEALVQAVRAYEWDQAIQHAIMCDHGEVDYFHPWFGADRAALIALDRAVALLAERGEER